MTSKNLKSPTRIECIYHQLANFSDNQLQWFFKMNFQGGKRGQIDIFGSWEEYILQRGGIKL